MIQRVPTVVYFPKHRMKVTFPIRPVILDYGNSHVSDEGFHYYNTSPFFFNQSVDIISIIISSLDIFVNKRTLDHSETKKLFLIMKYIRHSFKQPEREFHSMNQIKGFLKQNKQIVGQALISDQPFVLTNHSLCRSFLTNHWPYVQFFTRKPNLRSKNANFWSQEEKIRKANLTIWKF